ncbi:hypothetical protein COHA_008590 [Chlorella ohadii]|uniref:Uncharacterized protein n=1 Tax=Chlorella ohadii TaxID=2649997 RepID=A0AAD5H315_9CHLO|nr:hypothetical protein COHA_008590 [Chlorella ohadii]
MLVEKGVLVELPPDHIRWLIENRTVERYRGGEAAVYVVRWKRWEAPGKPVPIADGAIMAIKVYCNSDDEANVLNESELRLQVYFGQSLVRQEVFNLDILRNAGCADSIPRVVGVFQHPGSLRDNDQPLFGYVMDYYEHGSLAQFLERTCHRLMPESMFASFFSPMQLADPSRAQLTAHLDCLDVKDSWNQRHIAATWLWGCMASQHYLVDETADVFSTNICMLELWGVTEGAPMPLKEIAMCLRVDSNRPMGVTLLRALCTAMLKRHALRSTCGFAPRICRELPLSWLMLWAILLGCDDFHSRKEMDSGRHHRRPSVADMADVAARLKAVAAQMEALQGGIAEQTLEAPAGAALVQECVQLYNRLAALTRLDDPALLPADSSLCWVATRFLQQQHPLVAALKRQGALPLGSKGEQTIEQLCYRRRGFQSALVAAEIEAKWVGHEQSIAAMVDAETRKLQAICKEYRECQLEMLRLVPDDSPAARMLRSRQVPPELRSFMEGLPPLPPPAEQPQPASTEAPPPVADAVGAPAASAQLPAAAVNPAAAAVQPPDSTCAAPAAAPTQASLHPAAPAMQLAAAPPPLAFQALVPQPALPPAPGVQQVAVVPAAPASHFALAPAGAAAIAPPPPAALLAQLGVQLPPQPALEWLGLTQPVQLAAGQPTPGSQPCCSPQYQQQALAGQVPGGVQTVAGVASPCRPASPALSMVPALVGANWPYELSAAFAFGPSQRQQLGPAVPPSFLLDYSSPSLQAHIAAAGAAALGFGAASTPAAALCQPASPTKKRRLELGSSTSRAAVAAAASPVAPPLPRPRAYWDLFAEPAPTAGGQPALPPAQLPEWLRLLKEGRTLQPEVAAQLDTWACALSSKGQRMAAAVAAGLRLQPNPNLSYKKQDVEQYATALGSLVTSEHPPAGLDAQYARFRPIDTAGKLAWFLGWWASKERKGPHIPGLDMHRRCSSGSW